MRGYDYLQFVGQNVAFANAELRFPLIEAALTPIGVIGGIRGVFFANIGGGWFDNQDFRFFANDTERFPTIVDYETDAGRPDHDRSGDKPADSNLRRRSDGEADSGCRTVARHTALASRPSRSGSRSTSTGRGGRSSTRTGRTSLFARRSAASEFRKPRFSRLDRIRLLSTTITAEARGARRAHQRFLSGL